MPLPYFGLNAARLCMFRFRNSQLEHAIVELGFDTVPELAALVADLLEEMDELRARLASSPG
jgi:hypothetical protein